MLSTINQGSGWAPAVLKAKVVPDQLRNLKEESRVLEPLARTLSFNFLNNLKKNNAFTWLRNGKGTKRSSPFSPSIATHYLSKGCPELLYVSDMLSQVLLRCQL